MKKITVVFALALSVLVSVHLAQARQAGKVYRIGILVAGSPSSDAAWIEAFRQGLRELGYVEGHNIVIEYRYGEGKTERYPALVTELVQLKVEVIVVGGATAAAFHYKVYLTGVETVEVVADEVKQVSMVVGDEVAQFCQFAGWLCKISLGSTLVLGLWQFATSPMKRTRIAE